MISSLRRKPHITVLGSVNLDFIVKTKTLPKAGETIMHGVFETLPGGKGANVAMVAKRLGAEVALQACVGDDIYADAALETVRIEGVDLSNVIRLEQESTGVAFINVSEGGEGAKIIKNGDVIADASSPSVQVVDTTGAGDSFAAALTLGLVEGKAIEEALDFAVTVGALATTKLGTQSAAPYRNQVEKILYKNSI